MSDETLVIDSRASDSGNEQRPAKERKHIGPSASSRWWLPSIAALLLAGTGLAWWQTSAASAEAIVERAIQASQSPIDRRYEVVMESRGAVGIRKDAQLWVRGADRMLFTIAGQWTGTFRLGREGEKYWFQPPYGPVIETTEGNAVLKPLNMSNDDMPYLEIATVLQRIRKHYRLERVENESIEPGGPTFYHIVATLDERAVQENPPAGPPVERIELWGDRWSGVVRQLVLTKSSRAGVIDHWQATLTLAEEKAQPEDFYSPAHQR